MSGRITVTYPFRDPLDLPRVTILKGPLREAARRSAALITLLTDRVDASVLEAGRSTLRIVANVAVGVDNIDVAAATRCGIMVSNTPDVLTDATADLTWALLLAVARKIVAGDALVRRGGFTRWNFDLLRGVELRGKTLGIIGPGRIGRAVGRRARGFGMIVTYRSRSSRDSLRAFLEASDFISIHCPLTPATRHLIGAAELIRMKPAAILINTARGPIVDERALIEALRRGRIAGAGLDVYEREPRVPAALKRLKNVVLLPHIGSATVETRRCMLKTAVTNVKAALRGNRPPNLVNPETWRPLQ
ncbi:MAG: D-glycerate dehydrogenase [Planctomycetes bacterium]|nr:D-glycerate dehydrogenase [Planctomycetota bacterium]